MASLVRLALRVLVLAGLIFVGHKAIELVGSWLDLSLLPHTEDLLHRSIVLGTAVYVILMAIPFVPGAEIGLTLLTVLGGAIAPLVYLATVLSLMIAFAVGRLLPPAVLQRAFRALGLNRAADHIERASGMTHDDLRNHLAPTSAPRIVKALLRYRYVALAVAINTPGNVILGGGGGLALMAGLSRLFSPVPFLTTVSIAVLPVPLLFFLGHL